MNPTMLREVFDQWGCHWMWKDLRWAGNSDWIRDSIRHGECMVVADGSYKPDLSTELCSTAFFFECTVGRGKLVGSFAEQSPSANAYRGELLGLMAAHLVLLGINKLYPDLNGKVLIYSDCEGALQKVEGLPPLRIPSHCKHADILKNILINCTNLSFDVAFQHIKAHQDDKMDFDLLSRPAQLNCAVDAGAKRALHEAYASAPPQRCRFPLEPIVCYVGKEKMTWTQASRYDSGRIVGWHAKPLLIARYSMATNSMQLHGRQCTMACTACHGCFSCGLASKSGTLPVQTIQGRNGTGR